MTNRLKTIVAAVSLIALGSASVATAGPRVPQVPVVGGGLQAYFTSIGESINVNTDQQADQVFQQTGSGNSSLTLVYQSSPNAAIQQVGVYNASAVIPPLFFVLSGSVGIKGFSTMSFKPGAILVVNRFDAASNFLSTTTFGGFTANDFGIYLSVQAGTVFSQDSRNPGGLARMIAFKGTGLNAGEWFLCFDEPLAGAPGDGDFDDCVLVLESVNPLATEPTSLGHVKALFRK
ncbi:MAG TPA: hypothetical protein VJS69_08090 [Candidatus Krumholzibacteria bacterium]|nr:hypothetical protein [Candidatus Krumholzibacteria bacterium]